LLLALALLVVVDWLVDLGLGIAWLWGFVLPSPPRRRGSPRNSGAFAEVFGHIPMQMADANDIRGGQQD
jgi:hypothetical protein